MKQKKILAACLTALIILLAFMPTVSAEVVDPTTEFYVADYAYVIDDDTEDYIIAINDSLYEQTGAQIVVVTVDFLDGMDIEDYAYTLFNEWGIGSSTYNNGVLILLVIGEDNYWALQGSGIENVLSSGELGNLLYNYLEEDFAAKDYDSGARKIFDAVAERLSSYYNVTLSSGGVVVGPGTNNGGETPVDPKPVDPTPIDNDRPSSGLGVFWIIFIIIVVIIMISILRSASRRRRYYTPPRYNDPNRNDGNPTTPYNRPPTNSTTRTKKRSFFGRNDDDDHTPFGGGSSSGGGGSSRGGGAGRSFFGGSSSRSSGSSRSFGGSSSRRSGGFSGGSRSSGGGSSRSGGGGGSRGGGAGRR